MFRRELSHLNLILGSVHEVIIDLDTFLSIILVDFSDIHILSEDQYVIGKTCLEMI